MDNPVYSSALPNDSSVSNTKSLRHCIKRYEIERYVIEMIVAIVGYAPVGRACVPEKPRREGAMHA